MTAGFAHFLMFLAVAVLLAASLVWRRLAPHGLTLPRHPFAWLGAGFWLMLTGLALNVAATLSALGFTTPGDVIDYLLTTGPGRAALVTLLGTTLLLVAEVGEWSAPVARSGAAAGVTVLLWGLAGLGHGADHESVLVRAAHALHSGAMGGWVGGMLMLVVGRPTHWTRMARAFSPLALTCVVVLGVSGVLMGVSHAGPLGQWTASPYGRTLLLKLLAVLGVLAAAWRVRRHRSDRPANVPFLALRVELSLLLVVLVLTSVLVISASPTHG